MPWGDIKTSFPQVPPFEALRRPYEELHAENQRLREQVDVMVEAFQEVLGYTVNAQWIPDERLNAIQQRIAAVMLEIPS